MSDKNKPISRREMFGKAAKVVAAAATGVTLTALTSEEARADSAYATLTNNPQGYRGETIYIEYKVYLNGQNILPVAWDVSCHYRLYIQCNGGSPVDMGLIGGTYDGNAIIIRIPYTIPNDPNIFSISYQGYIPSPWGDLYVGPRPIQILQ